MTNEQLKRNAEAMLAFLAGKRIQHRALSLANSPNEWTATSFPNWLIAEYEYRPRPEPVSRPWSKPEDVPGPVCWVRVKHDRETDEYLIGRVVFGGFWTMNASGNQCWTWERLAEGVEYSTDRKTWKPCRIED